MSKISKRSQCVHISAIFPVNEFHRCLFDFVSALNGLRRSGEFSFLRLLLGF